VSRIDLPSIEQTLERARAYIEVYEFDAAIDVLEHAPPALATDRRLRRLLAAAALGAGDVARALVLLEALAVEQPGVETAKIDLGIALLASGRTDAARIVLERLTTYVRASDRAWACLGVAYERLGRAASANAAFAYAGCRCERERAEARLRATRIAIDES
jgi:predicted Zn-dependent protease